MADQAPELLTKERGLATRTDPTGKRWAMGVAPGGGSLYELFNVNDEGEFVKPRGYPKTPFNLGTMWTSYNRACRALDTWLAYAWDASEAVASRNARKAHKDRYTASVEGASASA
jgi:hypothetical protein